MNRQIVFAVAVMATAIDSSTAVAAPKVVIGTNVQLRPILDHPFENFSLSTGTPPFGDDGTAVFLQYDSTRVVITGQLADEGAFFFIAQPGDRVGRPTVLAQEFPPLTHPNGYQHNGNDFYIGIAAPAILWEEFPTPGVPPVRTEFGWVHLQPDGDQLRMLANVMSYESPGIIVGTSTLVPEPAAAALAVTGVTAIAFLRRRK